MAYNIQQSVADFHKKFGHPVRDTPQTIDQAEADQSFEFIEEELNELYSANGYGGCTSYCCDSKPQDVVEIADALGDIVVTAYGKALRHGIDLDLVLKEIMESNMTKEANGMGKIKKGADYRPPNIARVLGIQPASEVEETQEAA